MHQLTGFQRDLLVTIAGMDGPRGLAVKEILDDYYSSDINHGRLYPNLDELVEAGYIEKGSIDDRTNSYTLTEKGEKAMIERRKWEHSWIGG